MPQDNYGTLSWSFSFTEILQGNILYVLLHTKLVRILLFRDGQIVGWGRSWSDMFLFAIKAIRTFLCSESMQVIGKHDHSIAGTKEGSLFL